MSDEFIYYVAVLALLWLLWMASPGFRRIIHRSMLGSPYLRISDLEDYIPLTRNGFEFELIPITEEGKSHDVLISRNEISIHYHFWRGYPQSTEYIEIKVLNSVGMSASFVGGKITSFQRPGFKAVGGDSLGKIDRENLQWFLVDVRAAVIEVVMGVDS